MDHMSTNIRCLIREELAQDKSKEHQDEEHRISEDHDELVPSAQVFPGVLDFTRCPWPQSSAADSFVHFSVWVIGDFCSWSALSDICSTS